MRTEPASSMVNPAHIHITSAPQTRNENVLKTKRALLLDPRRVRHGGTSQEEDDRRNARRGQHGGESALQKEIG